MWRRSERSPVFHDNTVFSEIFLGFLFRRYLAKIVKRFTFTNDLDCISLVLLTGVTQGAKS